MAHHDYRFAACDRVCRRGRNAEAVVSRRSLAVHQPETAAVVGGAGRYSGFLIACSISPIHDRRVGSVEATAISRLPTRFPMTSTLQANPKQRVMRFAMVAAVLLTLVAAGGVYWCSAGSRSVTAALRSLSYDEAISTVDRLYHENPLQPRMSLQLRAPAALAAISPTMVLTEEGVYLPTHRSFVEEDGLFILRTGTAFDPMASGDPHFERVRDRLFRYQIAG